MFFNHLIGFFYFNNNKGPERRLTVMLDTLGPGPRHLSRSTLTTVPTIYSSVSQASSKHWSEFKDWPLHALS